MNFMIHPSSVESMWAKASPGGGLADKSRYQASNGK